MTVFVLWQAIWSVIRTSVRQIKLLIDYVPSCATGQYYTGKGQYE